ncbi:hypothetical protein RR48_11196 [Papilio machaon]|uniref:CUB domain-containing protein n=1 Tax=Papilio machaon TaxID=76193 RepID=A0A194QRN4_PAPMA|nr:hypothetical protein RR48_11196 [Papilio machaon]
MNSFLNEVTIIILDHNLITYKPFSNDSIQSCARGDYLKVYWEVQGPGPPGAINERSAWARELCGSRSEVPSALYSPGQALVLEFHTGPKQNNATGFVGTFSFIDKHKRKRLKRPTYVKYDDCYHTTFV